MLTIISVLVTNLALLSSPAKSEFITATLIQDATSASGSNYVVVADRVNLISSNAVTHTDYELSCSAPATYRLSNPTVASLTSTGAEYLANGSTYVLADTAHGTYTTSLDFSQGMPALLTNFYAFDRGTIGSNINFYATNNYGGKVESPATWQLFSGSSDLSLNTNCWGTNLGSFAGFITRGMTGSGPISMITSRHGISCMHAWDWTPGRQIYAVDTNGVKQTNWIESTASMGGDMRLVTLSNNFPSSVPPFQILSTNYPANLTGPDWKMIWFRANTGNLATSTTTDGNTDELTANRNSSGSQFNEVAASGGDSGGPCWFAISNKLVFAFSLHLSSVSGPFISNVQYYTNVLNAIGTNVLTEINL